MNGKSPNPPAAPSTTYARRLRRLPDVAPGAPSVLHASTTPPTPTPPTVIVDPAARPPFIGADVQRHVQRRSRYSDTNSSQLV